MAAAYSSGRKVAPMKGGICPDLVLRRVYHAARRSVTSVLALRRGRRNDVPDDVRSVAPQAVGTVPPSMTYSVPVIEAARGEARNTTRSATSFGVAGRPIGIPPSESINDRRAPS